MSSINNMSIKMFNAANTQFKAVEKIGVNNLDLYIPRVNENLTENDIKFIFVESGIGMVNYVDFVATKDPETKQIKFYSAFVKLLEWNPDGFWYNKVIVEKQNKVQVSRTEFWILLPAKTTISRSKVNTHQLVAYTDELFVKMEAVEKNVTDNMTISSEHFQRLLAKSEAQAAQIDQLMKIVEIQANQLTRINEVLFKNQVEETPVKKQRSLTIEDAEPVVLLPAQISEKLDTKADKKSPTYYEDECFFFKPLTITETTKRSPINKNSGIISGSFSCNLEDVLAPVSKSMGITKEQAKIEIEKEWANSQRVKSSKNFCGNA